MTRPVLPRALVHRGHQLATGLLLTGHPMAELRARALAHWTPGTRVLEVEGGGAARPEPVEGRALWLRFPAPRFLDADAAPGHLVVREDGVELAVPLTSGERAALAPPPGALVLVRAGVAEVATPSAELDPARWLALAPEVVQLAPLGAPPPPPADAPAPRDVRAVLSAPPPPPDLARVVAALAQAGRRGAADGALARLRGPGLLARLAPLFARLARLGRARTAPAALAAGARGTARAALTAAPRGPGFLRRLLERLALLSGIARLAGAEQAAYLRRMLEMFDRGDLAEALRHAIPLGDGTAQGLSFGTPGPRRELAIRPGQAPGKAMLASGPDLHAHLRQLYRATFDRLHAAGRFQEAAFVLAELLHADAEAVSYLERQGELRLAAELAEGRGLPPGLVVRQWFLARDAPRAVAVARRTGAYADAVQRLERAGPRTEATALRLLWAEDLAEAGDLENAVAVLDRVPGVDALRLAWMERAMAAGGAAGHALLFPWLARLPARFGEARALVRAACDRPAPEGPCLRAALVRGLLRAGRTPETSALARPVLRAVLRDRHAGEAALTGTDLQRLAVVAADGALDQDLPPDGGAAGRGQPAPLRYAAADADRGARLARDAAALPGGRVLVAHGEAGAELLAPDGHLVARLDAPAHRLVVSDLGTRALALAPRGEAVRVSWLDLEARTVRHLGDLRLGAFATRFDGMTWAVAVDRDVRLLDVLGGLRTVWRVPGAGASPRALVRCGETLGFVTGGEGEEAEGWRYEGAQLVLRSRGPALGGGPFALRQEGRWMTLFRGGGAAQGEDADPPEVVLYGEARSNPARVPVALGPGEPLALTSGAGAFVAAGLRTAAGVRVLALDDDSEVRATLDGWAHAVATLELAGAAAVRLRLEDTRLTVIDDLGRVVAVDLAARRLSHDLRT